MLLLAVSAVVAAVSLSLVDVRAAALSPRAEARYAPGAHAKLPRLKAKSFIAIDAETGTVLIARREHVRRPIASLTKIMTGLLVVEAGDLDRKVRVPKLATRVEPNLDGLKARRWYPVRLLLYSTMLESNNDAAATLGWNLGGRSLRRFYEKENARARDLGMGDTTYASASGLNDDTNLSTAFDQAILSRFALANPVFAKVVGTRSKSFSWPPPTYAKQYVNHNKMLFWFRGTYGVKTGYTSRAGGCLAVAVHRNGRSIVAVVLDSQNIWADMPRLVDRAFARLGR
jgi:D-alanyl-D-alanine carboxypeptidase (penicillin-binding protein 5/6)